MFVIGFYIILSIFLCVVFLFVGIRFWFGVILLCEYIYFFILKFSLFKMVFILFVSFLVVLTLLTLLMMLFMYVLFMSRLDVFGYFFLVIFVVFRNVIVVIVLEGLFLKEIF